MTLLDYYTMEEISRPENKLFLEKNSVLSIGKNDNNKCVFGSSDGKIIDFEIKKNKFTNFIESELNINSYVSSILRIDKKLFLIKTKSDIFICKRNEQE